MKMSVLLSAVLCMVASAVSATPVQPTFSVPNQQGNPTNYQSLENYGYDTYRVEASTVPTLLGAGSGLLYGVQCSSGVLGDFAVAFDSASASGITAATQGKALTPEVPSSGAVNTSTSAAGAAYNGWSAHGAARFTNGLVLVIRPQGASTATNCLAYALFDANVNSSGH